MTICCGGVTPARSSSLRYIYTTFIIVETLSHIQKSMDVNMLTSQVTRYAHEQNISQISKLDQMKSTLGQAS